MTAEPITLKWAQELFGSGGLTGSLQVVKHADDGTVARPAGAVVVFWVGAATPANALSYDFWYNADVA